MKTFFDCIPCIVRQTLDSVRLATPDEAVHQRVLREVLRTAAEMDLRRTPPEMAQWIHRRIREHVSQSDPYRQIKDRFNRMALELYPTLQQWVEDSNKPMETAVRLAIAGNVIDFGVNNQVNEAQVRQSVKHSLSASLDADLDEFFRAVSDAERILYLADNAGEIVFDRLLIERMPPGKVTVVVRGFPVINDATMTDAEDAGLVELVEVIDNGSDAPGTILGDCSRSFRDRFDEADLIIAKGQGNYETLSEVDKDIYFLLKVKCPVIARDIGSEMHSLVLRRSTRSMASTGTDSNGGNRGNGSDQNPR
jgi:damage-control phosphatase, subfamily I